MKFGTVILWMGLGGFAVAAAGEETNYLPGNSYAENGAKWSDKLARRKPGPGFCPKKLKNQCSMDSLVIRNESDHDIRCEIRIIYPQPNDANIANIESIEVIKADSERHSVHALHVPLALEPDEYGSTCQPVPDLEPLTAPANCEARFVRAPDAGSFYPADSVRRNEQGSVIVEFSVATSPGPPSDIEVVRSSEHADLDAAALKFMARSVLQTSCPGQRFRKTIPFVLTDG